MWTNCNPGAEARERVSAISHTFTIHMPSLYYFPSVCLSVASSGPRLIPADISAPISSRWIWSAPLLKGDGSQTLAFSSPSEEVNVWEWSRSERTQTETHLKVRQSRLISRLSPQPSDGQFPQVAKRSTHMPISDAIKLKIGHVFSHRKIVLKCHMFVSRIHH